MTEAIHTTSEKIRFTLDERQGLSVVYGEVGTGKTCLMRALAGEYEARDDCSVATLYAPDASTELGLLKAIAVELGIPVHHSRLAQESAFREYLANEFKAGRNVVVFVDETQRLKGEVLELFRNLLNFETDDSKLINVILFGQLELRDRLKDRSKKALRSRIFLYSVLSPMTLEDTDALIRFRLARARSTLSFAPEAVHSVYSLARGNARHAVKLCGAASLLAKKNDVSTVDAELVRLASESVEALPDAKSNGRG